MRCLYRLSLVFSRQGYSVLNSISVSLVRQNSTSTVCRHSFRAINPQRQSVNWVWNNEGIIKRTMGSVISKGRRYSPKKRDPNKQASTSNVEHDKFASGDSQVQNGDFIEKDICKENELEENQMKVFEIGEDGGKVLVVKQNGKISALGAKCTHYGAPLVSGALGDGRIRCQWHGACFNIANGDIEDFPGLDSLPCYQVSINNGNVRVRANKQHLLTNKRVKEFTPRDENNNTTFIVVGGGAAGANCVETLRQKGFSGKIILITSEPYPPYDRIKLSKALDIDVNKITLRPAEFYKERGIEVMLNTEVMAINPTSKSIKLNNNEELKYDKIFLATGSTPRRITAPGSDLKNIFVLRTVEDANQIKDALTPSANVVILGSSFIGLEAASTMTDRVKSVTLVAIEKVPFDMILGVKVGRRIQDLFEFPWLRWVLYVVAGMEAAAYCVDKARVVTVIARDKVPFKPSFGPIIGARIMHLFEEKGVKFQLEDSIVAFEGEDGALKSVTLKNGTKLPADVCLIGIGVVPNTTFLSSAGAKLERNGSIEVNEFLQTQWPDVYAGGDIAYAPVLGQKASIGHWGLANYHGHVAAQNMLGLQKSLNSVPFFWTVLFGKSFRYTGFATKFDDIVIDGDVKDLKFAAYYCNGDHVAAITTINSDPLAAKFAELLHQGKKLQKSQISSWTK